MCWADFPFWIGSAKSSLESVIANPQSGSNYEVRDGIYCNIAAAPPTNSPLPVIIPGWNGDVYVLNGKGSLDNPVNAIRVMLLPAC